MDPTSGPNSQSDFLDILGRGAAASLPPFPLQTCAPQCLYDKAKLGRGLSIATYPNLGRGLSIATYPNVGRGLSIATYPNPGRGLSCAQIGPYQGSDRYLLIATYTNLGRGLPVTDRPLSRFG